MAHLAPNIEAEAVSQRILQLAKDNTFNVNSLRVVEANGHVDIVANSRVIVTVTDQDARIAGKNKMELAYEYRETIQDGIENYRKKHSFRYIFLGVVCALIATVTLYFAFRLFRFIYKKLIAVLKHWGKFIKPFRIQKYEILPVSKVFDIIILFIKFLGVFLEIGIVYFYLVFVLGLFPGQKISPKR
ncbi:MAG: hypothetical protein MZV64_64840 [Ignavibacteriales bacterium]|nr:hypothetical protein [Ignavibacteriales bacterium]